MSIISQIPKPSFIFDPSQANENRDVLTQIRRIAEETGQSSPAYTRPGPPDFVNKRTVNKAGILVEAPANVPAVSFDQAFNKGYLAEAGATNLFLRSNELDNAYWAKFGSTCVEDSTWFGVTRFLYTNTAGGGIAGASLNGIRGVNISLSNSTRYALSGVIGGGSSSHIGIRVDGIAGTITASVDNSTGETNIISNNANPALSNVVVSANPFGDVWLVEISFTVAADGGGNYGFRLGQLSSLTNNASGTTNATLFMGMFQLEAGASATSRIFTEASTASRGADNLVFTDAQDIIGQQSGVILMEFDALGLASTNFERYISLQAGTTSTNRIQIQERGTGNTGIQSLFSGNGVNSQYANAGIVGKTLIMFDYDSNMTTTINGSVLDTRSITPWNAVVDRIAIGSDTSGSNIIPKMLLPRLYIWNNNAWLDNQLRGLLTS